MTDDDKLRAQSPEPLEPGEAPAAPDRRASEPAPPAAPRRPLRSSLALSAALVFLVLGALVATAALLSLSQPGRPDLGPSYAMTSLVTQAALLIVGVLNLGCAFGIAIKAGWSRRLGFGLALLGLAVGLIFYFGPLTAFRLSLVDPLMMVTLVAIVAYAWSLLALLVSGSHFRSQRPTST